MRTKAEEARPQRGPQNVGAEHERLAANAAASGPTGEPASVEAVTSTVLQRRDQRGVEETARAEAKSRTAEHD